MIKSMTGFGKATVNTGSRIVTIEVRALNSKQLDVNMRMPMFLRDREAEMRAEIARRLERGKIDFMLNFESDGNVTATGINLPLVKKYFGELSTLASELGLKPGSELFNGILSLPEITTGNRESIADDEWALIKDAADQALTMADEFRKQEGKLISEDMENHINLIISYLKEVEPFEKARITNLRERFERNKDEFIESSATLEKFDDNRFEQEIFWYLEKLDISEEKMRLGKHCAYFIESLASDESNGRKLGFISQEIGREINTLGSKAYDADMQRIVVQMKDELEKIKEQIGNVL